MASRLLPLVLDAACAAAALASTGAAAAPGQLDPAFGDRGRVHADNVLSGLGEDGTGLGSVRVLPDGRIVVVGSQRFCMGCFSQVVARYRPDGTPDPSFGAGGSGVRYFLGTDDYGDGSYGNGLVVRGDGGIVLGHEGGPAPRIASVAPEGAPAAVETVLHAPLAPRAQLPDGRIVAEAPGGRLVVLRPDLTPDPSFHGGAGIRVPAALGTRLGVAGTRDALLVAGTGGRDLLLARFPLDGSRATMMRARLPRPASGPRWKPVFPTDGLHVANGRAVIVSTWARTVGRETTERTVVGAFSLRAKGPVASFGKGGVAFVGQRYMRAALQRDGRVVLVAATSSRPSGLRDNLLIRRLDRTGRPDPTFPLRIVPTGLRLLMGLDMALDPKGRILVAGGAFEEYPSKGVLLMRFLAR